MLVLAALAAALSFDGLAYRRRVGVARFEAELARIEQARGWMRSLPEAERVAAMEAARDDPAPGRYRARITRLRRLDALWARQLEAAAGPHYPTAWLNARWLNGAMAARDADARALLLRTFVDQFKGDIDVPADLRTPFLTLFSARQGRVQRANAAWLKRVLVRIGWFDVSRYGAEASQAAWLIVQHADFDPAWQKEMLAALAPRVARGDMQGNYYAYLVDRVAVNAGQAQTYGTQGHCVAAGGWQPLQVAEPERLNERRRSVGLEPIAAYRARFTCR